MPKLQYHSYQPVGWLFDSWGSEDYGSEIAKLRRIAEGVRSSQLPANISVTEAEKMLLQANKAAQVLTDNARELLADLSNLFVAESISSLAMAVQRDSGNMVGALLNKIRYAKSSGQKTFPSREIKRLSTKVMMSVVYAYEGLADINESKPWFLRGAGVGLAVSLFISWAQAVQTVADYMPKMPDMPDFGPMLEILKWGSIATMLYIGFKVLSKQKGER